MCVNILECFFALLSSVSQVAAALHVHRLRGKVIFSLFFFCTEHKAVQESYLLVNLNDMFLQQNQTKKQWKWGRRNERRGSRKKREQGCEESEWVNKNVAIGIINSEREDPMFSMIFSQFRRDVAGPAATSRLFMQRNGFSCYSLVLNPHENISWLAGVQLWKHHTFPPQSEIWHWWKFSVTGF